MGRSTTGKHLHHSLTIILMIVTRHTSDSIQCTGKLMISLAVNPQTGLCYTSDLLLKIKGEEVQLKNAGFE